MVSVDQVFQALANRFAASGAQTPMDSDLLDALPEESQGVSQATPSQSGTSEGAPPPIPSQPSKAEERSPSAVSGAGAVPDQPRVDVSAATVARMMGIASTNDLKLLESKLDLLSARVAGILTKVDRCISMFSAVPTASDIGRLEVQLAAVKAMMKEVLDSVGAPPSAQKEQADRDRALEQSKNLRAGIKTNSD